MATLDLYSCPVCGHQVSPAAQVCIGCGHPLQDAKDMEKGGRRKDPGVAVLLTLLLPILGYAYVEDWKGLGMVFLFGIAVLAVWGSFRADAAIVLAICLQVYFCVDNYTTAKAIQQDG